MIDFIIIARSCRALAAAANRAGYKVCVADYFADEDTKRFSKSVYQLNSHDDGFLEEELLRYAQGVISHHPQAKIVLGTGFETKPELIDALGKIAPVLSNSKAAILALKNPQDFFGMLKHNVIPHPGYAFHRPAASSNYLIKKNAGIGGDHVNWAMKVNFDSNPDYYFQEYIAGVVSSALFLANEKEVRLIGFNRQLQSNDFADTPFLYQGAISLNTEFVKHKRTIENIINIITRETGLKGLCGLDYIVNDEGEVVVLEVNPRPPATFELYEDTQHLFKAHIACFNGELPEDKELTDTKRLNNGYAILYAKENCTINDELTWPSWVKDIPQPGRVIERKWPICTVHASENSIDKVKTVLFNHLQQIETMIAATQYAA